VAQQGLEVALIDPGKPWQNGMVESFNGKFRDECLSMEWFRSRTRRSASRSGPGARRYVLRFIPINWQARRSE